MLSDLGLEDGGEKEICQGDSKSLVFRLVRGRTNLERYRGVTGQYFTFEGRVGYGYRTQRLGAKGTVTGRGVWCLRNTPTYFRTTS